MFFNCFFTDEQKLGDFRTGMFLGNELKDFLFPRGKDFNWIPFFCEMWALDVFGDHVG